jgi:peptidoglycan/xylan/chitin deacetylase (PgdA/CDA1 family)
MMGQHAAAYPDIVRRVARDGHLVVANHSQTHPNFHKLSVSNQFVEIQESTRILSGFQGQRYFRYPYGNSTCESNAYLKHLGYKVVGWHVDSCDWAFNGTGSVSAKQASICEVKPENRSNFVQHVLDSVKRRNGGILLMHEVHPNTIHQMEEILDALIKEGYTFGRLNEPGFAASMR